MNVEVYEFIRNIGLILLCYLIGAIPFCNVIAKIHSNKDLRKIGDKNPGGWNLVFNIRVILYFISQISQPIYACPLLYVHRDLYKYGSSE